MRNLIANRVTERDIRKWLDAEGYFGGSAKINDLELHAISRPGWIQVFRFTVTAKRHMRSTHKDRPRADVGIAIGGSADDEAESEGHWVTRYGCVRDDERVRNASQRTQIEMFENSDDREQQLELWSDGLICRNSDNGDDLRPLVIVVLIFALAALALGAFAS